MACLCSWLVAMMDVTEHAQFLENYGKSPWRYTLHTLDAILDLYISKRWGSLLVTGFDIFQQVCNFSTVNDLLCQRPLLVLYNDPLYRKP